MLSKFSGERKEVLKKVSTEVFYEHINQLYSVDPDENFDAFDITKFSDFNTELNCPITAAEISKIISNLKHQKAWSAANYILNEYIKYSKDLPFPVYCKLVNVILQNFILHGVKDTCSINLQK